MARAIADDMARHGGIITYEDLAGYHSDVRVLGDEDLRQYRGMRYTPGGSNILVQLLNILENFDLASMGPDNPTYRHLMLETMRRTWVNYFAFGGEPGLLTKEYAREVAGLIRLDKASHNVQAVEPWPYQEGPRKDLISSSIGLVGGNDTTTLAAADREGNVINILTSLGRVFGSDVVVPGTGIILNDHMCSFDPVPGRTLSLGPSRRPPQGAHVPLFFRDGQPFLAMSASGARRSMSAVINTVVHCIDFGMGIQEAIDTPRAWAEALYPEAFLESRVPEEVQRALENMGHRVVAMDSTTSGGFGRPTAVGIDTSGRLHGAADSFLGTGIAGF